MYVYIKGILKYKSADRIVVENSGMGYGLTIASITYNNLPDPPEEVMLYTYHYVREDKEELYGFSSMAEKELFELIIGISNIGPSKAINIMSQITPSHFINAVKREDVVTVASIKGVGKKTAERIILDLKDKIHKINLVEEGVVLDRSKMEDALSGLLSLGFKANVARELIYSIKNEIDDSDQPQDIIKKALKHV